MTRWAFCIGVVCAAVVASAAITVKPVRISETRSRELTPKQQQRAGAGAQPMMHFGAPEGLTLTLRLDGPEAKGATKYGKLKITEARDDAGTSLLVQEQQPGFGSGGGQSSGDEFQPFGSGPMHMGMSGSQQQPQELTLDVRLGSPARKATRITRLKGQMQVLGGGQSKVVTIKNPASLVGKPINDPVLKQAGVQIKLIDPKTANSGPMGMMMGSSQPAVALEIGGKRSAIQAIDLVDAAGRSLARGTMTTSGDSTETRSISTDRPLNPQAALKITVSVGQKPTTVPFDLTNIPLP